MLALDNPWKIISQDKLNATTSFKGRFTLWTMKLDQGFAKQLIGC